MRRGSTPTHEFKIPFNADMVDKCQIIYQQEGETVLLKDLQNGLSLQDGVVSLTLTEDETFSFNNSGLVSIQARVMTKTGQVIPSDIISISVRRLLFEEVIS